MSEAIQAGETEVRRRPLDTFGSRLVRIRHDQGHLSQEEAAKKCGLSPASWHTWEHGTNPRDKTAIAAVIAEVFGYDRDWVAWGGMSPEPPIIPGLTSDKRVTRRSRGRVRQRPLNVAGLRIAPSLDLP